MQHFERGPRRRAPGRVFRLTTSLIAILGLLGSTIAPAYAVSSSSGAPALGGLSVTPSAGTETAPMDASLTAPYSVENVGGGSGFSMQTLSSGSTDPTPTVKFTPPDTPYNGAFTRSIALKVLPF